MWVDFETGLVSLGDFCGGRAAPDLHGISSLIFSALFVKRHPVLVLCREEFDIEFAQDLQRFFRNGRIRDDGADHVERNHADQRGLAEFAAVGDQDHLLAAGDGRALDRHFLER